MINGLDIYYSRIIGRGLKPVSKKTASGLKPVSTNKKTASGLKPISKRGSFKKYEKGLRILQ